MQTVYGEINLFFYVVYALKVLMHIFDRFIIFSRWLFKKNIVKLELSNIYCSRSIFKRKFLLGPFKISFLGPW